MSGTGGAADLLVVAAPVYTADPARRWADAVAVGDAQVLATLVEGEPVHADPGLDLAG